MRRVVVALALVLPLVVAAPGSAPAQPASPPPDTQPPPPSEPAPPDPRSRVAGEDRVGTAIAVAQAGWATSPTVLLASAADFPDALAGAALAADRDAPLLLTPTAALPPAVASEIARLGAATVVILGGPGAVSQAVEDDLVGRGLVIERIAGPDRYATAAVIATTAGAPAGVVTLASGQGFADAVAAGAFAAGPTQAPTLLTAADALPPATAEALAQLEPRTLYLVGGPAAVSEAVAAQVAQVVPDANVRRLGGATRYDTAVLVASEALTYTGNDPRPLVIATGEAFPDALTAAPLTARRDGLLLLSASNGVPVTVARLADDAGELFAEVVGVGGPAALSDIVLDIFGALASGTRPFRSPIAIGDETNAGAAATVDPFATQTALDVLAAGGNAVDATIAAAGVLGVVEPFSAGIGGGGFMVVYDGPSGEVTTFDSREEAPAAYTSDIFLDEDGEEIPFEERVVSGLGVGVPGTVAGWQLALDQFGSRTLGQLLQPGIDLAQRGFQLDRTLFEQIFFNEAKFATFESTADLYLRGGVRPTGSWFRNPDLAATYQRIAEAGPDAFYNGPVAEAIVAATSSPPLAQGAEPVLEGVMSLSDLAFYEAIERPPVATEYRDFTYYGMGLPSSGGLTIALALNQLERFEMGEVPRDLALHYYLESIHRAWADRNAYMGDPDFVDVPVEGLLSQAYADDRSADIGPMASTDPPQPPGDPFEYQDGAPADAEAQGEVTVARDGSTTHLTVSDAEGSVVAYTFTIEQIGGSGIVVPGYGFLLNNELTDFNPVPPHPNEPAAGKRPRSSISPSIILRDGEPFLALGTPGGATIITTVLQVTLNVLDFDRTIDQAIVQPRLANFNAPESAAEPAFLTSAFAPALEDRGHTFVDAGEIGAVTGIQFRPNGAIIAAAEPVRRGTGSAGVLQGPD